MNQIRDDHFFILPWKAFDLFSWLFWRWERNIGMGLKGRRFQTGSRLFGFTYIQEWR